MTIRTSPLLLALFFAACGPPDEPSPGDTGTSDADVLECTPTADEDLTCDGIDDDCDGAIDEDVPSEPSECGQGACAATGTRMCLDGVMTDSCTPGTGASDDSQCDGIDNDCDGAIDEDVPSVCVGDGREVCLDGEITLVSCNNGNPCDGTETCRDGQCVLGEETPVDDGDPCTLDYCDPELGVSHLPAPDGTRCGDGRECTATGECVATTVPQIVTQPTDQTGPYNGSVTFEVEATGGNLHYQWFRNGRLIDGATAEQVSRDGLTWYDEGVQYGVQVHNGQGVVESERAVIHVIDNAPPLLEIDQPEVFEADEVATLTGRVYDESGSPVNVVVQSPHLSVPVSALLNADDGFEVQVPLDVGENPLTIIAADEAGNRVDDTRLVTWTVGERPVIFITDPLDESTSSSDVIAVTGVVHSTAPAEEIRLTVRDHLTFPVGDESPYTFSVENVRLRDGVNAVRVDAETVRTVASRTVHVRYRAPEDGAEGPHPPTVTVRAVGDVVYAAGDATEVSGLATDDRCVSRVTVNDLDATLYGTGREVRFEALVSLDGPSTLIEVTAYDCDGLTDTVSYHVERDQDPPEIDVTPLALAPEVNGVTQMPYRLSGTITEARLAGFTINDMSVSVEPGGGDTWSFRADVPLVSGTPRSLVLRAWDHAGQLTEREVVLEIDTSVGLQVTQPGDGDVVLIDGEAGDVEIEALVPGHGDAQLVRASVGARETTLSVAEGRATGTLNVEEGAHTMRVWIEDAGVVLIETEVSFEVVNQATVPLRLLSAEPERGAFNLEPDEQISLYFNRSVPDPLLLEARVYETVHGEVYARPTVGATPSARVVYERVDHTREPVPATLVVLPGAVTGYLLADGVNYGASLDVELFYDDSSIGRLSYLIRPVPTLVQGFVVDTDRNPVQGVTVHLDELDRTTETDIEGAYYFGFDEPAERDLPGGRFTVQVNRDGRFEDLAVVERRVTVDAERHNPVDRMLAPRYLGQIPLRALASGEVVTLDEGGLVCDLSEATARFATGADSGAVRVQRFLTADLPYGSQLAGIDLDWAYVMTPPVELEGELGLELAVPDLDETDPTLGDDPAWVILMGLDTWSYTLRVVGVGAYDPVLGVVSSRGALALERLDVLGYAAVSSALWPALEAYAAGEMDLESLNVTLQTGEMP